MSKDTPFVLGMVLIGGDQIRTEDAVKSLCDMCGCEIYIAFKDRIYHQYRLCGPCAKHLEGSAHA